jgi:hypothetical protein
LPLDGLFNPIRVFRDNDGFFSFFENRGGVDFFVLFSSPSRGLSPSTMIEKKIEFWRHSSRSMVMIEPR